MPLMIPDDDKSGDIGKVLDAFTETLCEHWREARDRTLRLFSTPVSWLETHRNRPPDHHLTRGGKLIK